MGTTGVNRPVGRKADLAARCVVWATTRDEWPGPDVLTEIGWDGPAVGADPPAMGPAMTHLISW